MQSLTLVWCGEGEKSQLQCLIRNVRQYAPSLRKLEVAHRVWKAGFSHLEYRELSKLCQDNDIMLSVVEDKEMESPKYRPLVDFRDTSDEESLYSV